MPYSHEIEGRTPLSRELPTLRNFVDNGSKAVSNYFAANLPEVMAQPWPSSNVVASSRSMAKLLAATLGKVEGRRNLKARRLDEMRRERSRGVDWVLRYPIRFGSGVQLPFPQLPFTGQNSFGHQGGGGCVAFADLDLDIAAYSNDALPACDGASLLAVALFSTIRYLCQSM
jgi:hypothetical protein